MEAADELRRMSGSLHPVVLEQQGLLQALGSLSETLRGASTASQAADAPAPHGRPRDERARHGLYHVARETSLHAARRGAALDHDRAGHGRR